MHVDNKKATRIYLAQPMTRKMGTATLILWETVVVIFEEYASGY